MLGDRPGGQWCVVLSAEVSLNYHCARIWGKWSKSVVWCHRAYFCAAKKSVEERTETGLGSRLQIHPDYPIYFSLGHLSCLLLHMLIPDTSQTHDSQRTTSALRSILFSTGSTHPKLTMATDKRETGISLSDYESSKAIHNLLNELFLVVNTFFTWNTADTSASNMTAAPAGSSAPPIPVQASFVQGEHGVPSRGLLHLFPPLLDMDGSYRDT